MHSPVQGNNPAASRVFAVVFMAKAVCDAGLVVICPEGWRAESEKQAVCSLALSVAGFRNGSQR